MKILVLGSEQGDYLAHNIAYTLRKMGHEVTSDPLLGSASGKSRLRRGVELLIANSNAQWARRDDRRAIRIAGNVRPDLAIATTRTYEPATIQQIRQLGCLVICWFCDSPSNLSRGHITSGEYDAVFAKDRRFAHDLRDVLGLNAYHLHEACNSDWHRRVNVGLESHIVAAGTMYGYRNKILEKLLDNGWELRVFGPKPSPWVASAVANAHTGIFLDHQNKAAEFGKGLACLNTFSPAERDALNCRIFETCGCGSLLVSEHKDAIDECFEPGKEYLPFSTFGQLLEQLERLRRDRKLSGEMRIKALQRSHGEHTYEHRLKSIFKTLDL